MPFSGAGGGEIWANLVNGIKAQDERAVEQFYGILSDHVRGALSRTVGPQAVDDLVHEVLVIIIEAIRAGELRDPSRLMPFMRRIAQRRGVAHIRRTIFLRRKFVMSEFAEPAAPVCDSPDSPMQMDERLARMSRALGQLGTRDREILERFYLQEQPREQICDEMNLTDTQFRLFKSRAIARCSSFDQSSRP